MRENGRKLLLEVEELSLRYPGRSSATLRGVNLRVYSKQLVLLAGPSGCGKSTLLGCLNGLLFRESSAEIGGVVRVAGQDIRGLSLGQICRMVGTVFQNPETQICTHSVESEVAFGLENLNLEPQVIAQRIDEVLQLVGLAEQRYQRTDALSGGQKQRLAIACALALRPQILLLDEPLSQLDPRGAREILELMVRLHAAGEGAMIVVEQRLEEVLPLADHVVLMDGGSVVFQGSPRQIACRLELLKDLGLNVPLLPEAFSRLGRTERPLVPEEAPLLPARHVCPTSRPQRGPVILKLSHLEGGYDSGRSPVLRDICLEFCEGDRVALMGANGSGKTTLLSILSGLLRPWSGRLEWKNLTPRVGLVMQSPDLMLFCDSVREELGFAPRELGFPKPEQQAVVAELLHRLDLESLGEESPFALSRGQRLRVAIGSVMTMRPNVLLLDEPTAGQNLRQVDRIMSLLKMGMKLVVFCTHDVQLACRHATRLVLLDEGEVVFDGLPEDALFEEALLERTSLRRTGLQEFAFKLGIRALGMEDLLAAIQVEDR